MRNTRTLVFVIVGLIILWVAASFFNIRLFNRNSAAGLLLPSSVPGDLRTEKIENEWREIRDKRKPLSTSELITVKDLALKTSPLPYRNKDVDVGYSKSMQVFFIQKKTPQADSKLKSFLGSGMYQMYEQNDKYRLFIITPYNVDYTKYTYEMAKNTVDVKGVYAQGVPAEGYDDSPIQEDFTNMMDLFKAATTIMGGGPGDDSLPGAAPGGGGNPGGGGTVPGNVLPPGNPQGSIDATTLARCVTENRQVYIDAERATSVPWYVLAAIHYREGNCNSTVSLRSGRGLGDIEPDVSEGCAGNTPGQGKPVPIAGGCTFDSLLDSAINTGNFLRGKIGGAAVDNEQKLSEALAGYNGWGNTNCNDAGAPRTPYTFCPPRWPGDDHPYVYNLYDADRHGTMYVRYCSDGRLCSVPYKDERLGVMTAAFIILRGSQQGSPPIL